MSGSQIAQYKEAETSAKNYQNEYAKYLVEK